MIQINKFFLLLVIGAVLGALIGWIDSSPNWNDAGITAAALIVVSGSLGFVKPNRAWLFAIVVGIWVPIFNFLRHHDLNSWMVIMIAIAGAYIGVFFKKIYSARIL